MAVGDVVVVGATAIAKRRVLMQTMTFSFKEVKLVLMLLKLVIAMKLHLWGSGDGAVTTAGTNDASAIALVTGIINGDTLVVGQRFTVDKNLSKAQLGSYQFSSRKV